MEGVILPDCGGAWVPDTGGGGEGDLPTNILQQLRDHGKNGVVISGLVAWMEVQMNTEGCDIWRGLAERNWLDSEVTHAKEALSSACGDVLTTLVPEFKTRRQKKEKEIEDIRKAIVALQINNRMPLVLASTGMMKRCPPAWGQPATATTQDVMGKVHMLEEVMTNHMEQQRKQMESLSQQITAMRGTGTLPKIPGKPDLAIDLTDTPSKKRKLAESTGQTSYAAAAGAAVGGVHPLPHGTQQQPSMSQLQQVFQQQINPRIPPRSPRNICFGTAKSSGDQNIENMLAADVDLVASGVSKDCSDDDLSQFLKGKGIETVAVETLTRTEILDQVRTKTFKITVKAAQYEAALKPEVWPYRVAVRHYKAPRRQETTGSGQSGRVGGLIDKGSEGAHARQRGGHPGGLHGGQQQVRHGQPPAAIPDSVQLSNFFSLLGQLGSKEIPPH